MSDDNVTKQQQWKHSKLDEFEDVIVWDYQNNVSLRGIQVKLSEQGVTASISTISAFIKRLPPARLKRYYEPVERDRYGRRQT